MSKSGVKRFRKKPIIVRSVVGTSMLPTLRPGKIIIAQTWFISPKLYDVIVFEHGGKEKIKRIVKLEDGKMFLHGDNAEFSTDSRTFGWLEVSALKAKVVWPRPYMK